MLSLQQALEGEEEDMYTIIDGKEGGEGGVPACSSTEHNTVVLEEVLWTHQFRLFVHRSLINLGYPMHGEKADSVWGSRHKVRFESDSVEQNIRIRVKTHCLWKKRTKRLLLLSRSLSDGGQHFGHISRTAYCEWVLQAARSSSVGYLHRSYLCIMWVNWLYSH